MINLDLNAGGHKWHKKNLMTIFQGKRHYDIMECEYCKIIGKTSSLSTILIKETYKREKVFKCPIAPKQKINIKEYVVTKSPWITDLPNGTIIVSVEKNGEEYFKIKNSKGPFLDSEDGTFKLWSNECELLSNPPNNETK